MRYVLASRIGHDLHRQGPARSFAARDRLDEVAAMKVGVRPRRCGRLGVSEERHALAAVEMNFTQNLAPEALTRR